MIKFMFKHAIKQTESGNSYNHICPAKRLRICTIECKLEEIFHNCSRYKFLKDSGLLDKKEAKNQIENQVQVTDRIDEETRKERICLSLSNF